MDSRQESSRRVGLESMTATKYRKPRRTGICVMYAVQTLIGPVDGEPLEKAGVHPVLWGWGLVVRGAW